MLDAGYQHIPCTSYNRIGGGWMLELLVFGVRVRVLSGIGSEHRRLCLHGKLPHILKGFVKSISFQSVTVGEAFCHSQPHDAVRCGALRCDAVRYDRVPFSGSRVRLWGSELLVCSVELSLVPWKVKGGSFPTRGLAHDDVSGPKGKLPLRARGGGGGG